jgi:LysM repeat protein
MSDNGSLTGVDLNFFRGTLGELYALAGATIPDGTVVDVPKVDVLQQVDEGKVVLPVEAIPPVMPHEPPAIIKHLIKSGDTLFAIALKYHTTVDAIVQANPQITNPNLIRDGETLTIPQ